MMDQAPPTVAREAVHVLPLAPKALVWPHRGPAEAWMFMGMVWMPVLLTTTLGRTNRVLLWVGIVVSGLVILGVLSIGVRRLWGKMTRKRVSGTLPPPGARLRVMAPLPAFMAALDAADDTAFEPVVFRLLLPPMFSGLDFAVGFLDYPKLGNAPKSKAVKPAILRTPALWALDIAIIAASVAAILVLHHLETGSWFRQFNQMNMWAAVALAGVLSAFAKPSYVRFAPGTLDVFLYGPLGIGPPRVERFDLRHAKVTVDEKRGWIGIADDSRAALPALFLSRRCALTLESLAVWTFRAARSTHPTPPLAMDELSG